MTQTAEAREVYFERLRVARLSASGATPAGAENGYCTDAIVRLALTPNRKAGKEINRENGRGENCLTFKLPDSIIRYDAELTICGTDPELTELLAGGTIYREDTDEPTIGYRAPRLGSIPVPNGVSIEGWSNAVDSYGNPVADLPFWHYAIPRVFLTEGAFSLEADARDNTFTGYAVENPSWGNGPWNDWDGPDAISAWQRVRVAALPASALGYIAVPVQA